MPLIHKDVVLESLHDSLEVGDHTWRHRLSLAADDIPFALAADAGRAVLVNWWHHDTAPDRLQPGHLDQALTHRPDPRTRRTWAPHPGPLTLGGPLRPIDTSRPVDIGALRAVP
ncbi:hypothetical protein ACFRJ1_38870 [Streptomyces sp. NPDC056773]|uniref:hypothetical protein n=1 Tax=unclassified Streptomyces TaxID=2593676 RepID=UPI0036B82FF5